ncbi:MAG: hypothetical protein IT395_07540 [Candidatus Omnitrophica bacterium]|nr:hypothetical protein [Candidatus Omnitrophota bacterium]
MRSYLVFILSLMTMVVFSSPLFAEQDQSLSQTQSISPDSQRNDLITGKVLWGRLNLQQFVAVDESQCVSGGACSAMAANKCAALSCSPSGSKEPSKCYGDKLANNSSQADLLICQAVESPTPENMVSYQNAFPETHEADFVAALALMQAVKGDGAKCQDMIKQFVGPYGKDWPEAWLVNMSGCRILSNQRQQAEEEQDYLIWHNIAIGETTCYSILGEEIKMACVAGVKAP